MRKFTFTKKKLFPFFNFIFLLLFLFVSFSLIINPIEKKIVQLYFGDSKRPLEKCKNSNDFKCFGMPSGHTELATVISFMLYSKKYISLFVACIIIFIFAMQRIVTSMHSIIQVIAGFALGLLYSLIFVKLHKNLYIVIFVLLLSFVLNCAYIVMINTKIKEYPNWVLNDSSLEPILKKKYNIPFYAKFSDTLFLSRYIGWNELENNMDILISKIKQSGTNFDVVVGIKSGGAILSKYIANKLDLKCYYIKISDKDDGCDKNLFVSGINYGIKKLTDTQKEYIICEGIHDNIMGKNILLIDEQIASGNTMKNAIDYLYKNKKASFVLPCAIYLNPQQKIINTSEILFLHKNRDVFIWSWGFNN
jgi:hypoxanthine phosphoribosyltransferase